MKNIPIGLRIKFNILKFRNFLIKNKLIILITIFFIFIIAFRTRYFNIDKLWARFSETSETNNNALVSTLMGAIVGGVFTLLGSYTATKNNIRLKANINQSRTIFAPIYDEIVSNACILENQPFPLYELIKSKRMPTHIYYDAWDRIKSDYRIFEVNNGLSQYMGVLYDSIRLYERNVMLIVKNLHSDLGKILVEFGLLKEDNTNTSNLVEILFSEILNSKNDDYLQPYTSNLSSPCKTEELHIKLLNKIRTSKDYKMLCESQQKWADLQTFGVKYLGELIKNVNLRQVK